MVQNKTLIFLALVLLSYSLYKKNITIIPHVPHIPHINVPIPSPIKPELKTNIIYNNIEQALSLGKEYNRNIVLIFGANWCPYCRDLKKDIEKITNFKHYIVCLIDTDKFRELTDKYKIRGLPTSLIIDTNEKEIARKSGYKYNDYEKWLEGNHMENINSWTELKN